MVKKKALITGISGFVGGHLARYLLEKGYDVHGIVRWRSNLEGLKNIIDKVNLVNGDLTDANSMHVVGDIMPDVIYHLAAQSYIPSSYAMTNATMDVNINGIYNLFNAILNTGTNPRIICITSSEVYGDVKNEDLPITEDTPLNPISPYAVSKAAQDLAALQNYFSYNLDTIRVRNFTTTGAGRGSVFFESAFSKQLAAIKVLGKEKVVNVGNLDSIRVLTNVSDMVRGYHLLEQHGVSGEAYNVGGGSNPVSVGEVLNRLIEISGIRGIEVVQKEELLRPVDVTNQVFSNEKFVKETGWKPRKTLNNTLKELYNYWIVELQRNPYKEHSVA